MNQPHKHAELIKAWADGAEIEYRWSNAQAWIIVKHPEWDGVGEFRIKPNTKPDVVTYYYVNLDKELFRWSGLQKKNADLRITVDGETGKIKSAEIL